MRKAISKILVTGGAGFIGSAFLKKLNDQGYDDILVVDELVQTAGQNLGEVAVLVPPGLFDRQLEVLLLERVGDRGKEAEGRGPHLAAGWRGSLRAHRPLSTLG